jgi:hypothetical protein
LNPSGKVTRLFLGSELIKVIKYRVIMKSSDENNLEGGREGGPTRERLASRCETRASNSVLPIGRDLIPYWMSFNINIAYLFGDLGPALLTDLRPASTKETGPPKEIPLSIDPLSILLVDAIYDLPFAPISRGPSLAPLSVRARIKFSNCSFLPFNLTGIQKLFPLVHIF